MVDDVLVIGAGAAGLTAAYDLFWSEYSVKILEASNSFGGRLRKNDNFADFPIDMGAEWIHVNPSILDVIVDDPNWPVGEETYLDKQKFGSYDPTWDEWYLEDVLSTDYKFKGYTWYDFFSDYIAWDVHQLIDYGCQVTDVWWKTDPPKARCANGDVHEAWHIIVTASVGVLARGDITFHPALPSKLNDAISQAGSPVNFPGGVKTWLKFDRRFWDVPSFALEEHCSDKGEIFFYDASFRQDSNEYILGVYTQGDLADDFENSSNGQIIDAYLDHLTTMFGPNVRSYYTGESLVQDWTNEPYVGGSFSMYHTGYSFPIRQLRKSRGPYQELWFAGEAIPRGDWEWGFAHGAALSGRGAAAGIMSIYGDVRHLELLDSQDAEEEEKDEVEESN